MRRPSKPGMLVNSILPGRITGILISCKFWYRKGSKRFYKKRVMKCEEFLAGGSQEFKRNLTRDGHFYGNLCKPKLGGVR